MKVKVKEYKTGCQKLISGLSTHHAVVNSLNLALSDIASLITIIFGIIQCIYNLFASSTNNCEVFREIVIGVTIKPLSQIRWESRIKSVKAIQFHTP